MKEQILKILEEIHPNVDYLSEESLTAESPLPFLAVSALPSSLMPRINSTADTI